MSREKAAEIIAFDRSRAKPVKGEQAGDFLAAARRAAGLGFAEISAAIKVKTEHLAAIEASDMAALPAAPYAVGFVKVYANYLGLDAAMVAARFKDDIGANAPPPEEDAEKYSSAPMETGAGVRIMSLFGIVAILAFAIWVMVQVTGRSDRVAGAPAEVRLGGELAPQPRPRVFMPPAREAFAEEAGDPVSEIIEVEDTPLSEAEPVAPAEMAPVLLIDIPEPVAEAPPTDGLPAPAADLAPPADVAAAEPAIVLPAPVEIAPLAPIGAPEQITPAMEPEPVIVAAQLTRSRAPKYPRRCDRGAAGIEQVSLIFDVTAAGRTANTRVLASTNACFDTAAVAAIQRWRFDPRTVDGAARPQEGLEATLNFRR